MAMETWQQVAGRRGSYGEKPSNDHIASRSWKQLHLAVATCQALSIDAVVAAKSRGKTKKMPASAVSLCREELGLKLIERYTFNPNGQHGPRVSSRHQLAALNTHSLNNTTKNINALGTNGKSPRPQHHTTKNAVGSPPPPQRATHAGGNDGGGAGGGDQDDDKNTPVGLLAVPPNRRPVVAWRRTKRKMFLAMHLRGPAAGNAKVTPVPAPIRRGATRREGEKKRTSPKRSKIKRSTNRACQAARQGGRGGEGGVNGAPGLASQWREIWPRMALCEVCRETASVGGDFLGCITCDQVVHKRCSLPQGNLQPPWLQDTFEKRDQDGRNRSIASSFMDSGCGVDHQCIDDTDCTHCSALPRWVCPDCIEALTPVKPSSSSSPPPPAA